MAIPKEPRALMIQLMYLVLTAMLALNITREVLNAFNTINSSIERSNATIDQKNQAIYDAFDKAESKPENRDKVKPLNDKAKEIKQLSSELVTYINGLKDTIITRSGGLTTNERTGLQEPSKMEDIDVATVFFVEIDKKGDELKGKLQDYIDKLLSFLPEDQKESFRSQIPINLEDYAPNDDNKTGDWSRGTFNNIPIIGAMTLLSKFQNDIKNAEGFVIEDLFKQIHINDIHIDAYEVIAVPNVSYALAGDEIVATVTLAAYSKSIVPQISHNSGGSLKVENGVGKITFKAANSPGLQTVRGNVTVPMNGKMENFPFDFSYMVGSTGASLGLDKMNVFYIGVDNPITVSASGYNIEDVNLKFEDGDVKKKETAVKGKYNVTVTKPNAKGIPYVIEGKDKATGTYKPLEKGVVRVKRIPDPIAKLGGYSGGNIPINMATTAKGPIAVLENFDFDVRFTIISFTFLTNPKSGQPMVIPINGTLFTNEAMELINRARPGDRWFLTDIKAKGPDGTQRNLPTIALTLI